ncbi:hypothetical protein AKO1_007519 [Acrasis kona]|uniref:GOLD domain-containing protein n=1 Tax=Acrasis kona TaxID=1008807 RepID=A0AAW2YU42_9EUKA
MRTLSLLCVFGLVLFAHVNAITMKIEPQAEECIFENIDSKNVKFNFGFQVASGGFLDIDASVDGPRGNNLYRVERESEGKFTYTTDDTGLYKICFSNVMSTVTPKTVNFQINVGGPADPSVARLEHLDPIEKSIMSLSEGLASVQSEQKYLKVREAQHRAIADQTNQRVTYFNIFSVSILLAMSLFQVYYLKRFFEVKRTGI